MDVPAFALTPTDVGLPLPEGWHVGVRTLVGGTPFPKESHQVNLLQGKEGNVGSIPGAESTGLIQVGEWNKFDITCIGDTISMKINGKDAYKMDMAMNSPGGNMKIQTEGKRIADSCEKK